MRWSDTWDGLALSAIVSQLFCHFIYLKINFNGENGKKQVVSWDFMGSFLKLLQKNWFTFSRTKNIFNIFQADNISVYRQSWISEAAEMARLNLENKNENIQILKKLEG